MSRKNRYRHVEINKKGLYGAGCYGSCSVTDRKTIKRVTARWRRKEYQLYIAEGLLEILEG